MNLINKIITKIVADAFVELGYDEKYGVSVVSSRKELGQFQCNGAFACAKEARKAPLVIANEVLEILKENEIFSDVNVVNPGFINMSIKDEQLINLLNKIQEEENYGITKEESKTIVIDYGGPNIAKPLHVGHLRSAIIGESIKRIAKTKGHQVIGDIHLGDWGLQMGLILALMEERIPEIKNFDGKSKLNLNINLDDLNTWYPEASARSKIDEEFMEKAAEITLRLQNKEKKYYEIWAEIVKISTNDLKKSYDLLRVHFDIWYGESDSSVYIDDLVTKLENTNLLYESEGALVVDVALEDDEKNIPPVLIKKSNGAILYPTTDLATIIQRVKDFDPTDIYYVVDNRQSLHFTQVFRCAKLANLIDDKLNIEHIGFGTMNGIDGKPYKTRDGGVLKLSDLIDEVINKAKEKINQETYNEKEKEEIAFKVGMSALKFGDLINFRGKDYIFDLERFLSFEGKTGPYLLYSITRINSILEKAQERNLKVSELIVPKDDSERDLMLNLLLINEVFSRAFNEKAPNIIADNAYNLAVLFNKFYSSSNILNETNTKQRGSWLRLITLVKQIIEIHLNVLGIETLNKM